MKYDWNKVCLSDLVKIKHGYAYKGKFFSDNPTNDILVTPGNFHIGGGFKNDKLKYYGGPIEDDYILKTGDLIVTMTDLSKKADTLGYSALVPDDDYVYHHNQRIGLVEIKDSQKIDKLYLYFLLRTPSYRQHVISHATGSTVKHTSPTKICSFEFDLPPLETQEDISSHLMSIELKIHLNQKTNQTLESMAQALFKSWFVDFDPVRAKIRAKADGRDPQRAAMATIAGVSMEQDWDEMEAQLDQKLHLMKEADRAQLAKTANLFPDELVESEYGDVPRGWGISKLEDYITLSYGKSLRKKDRKAGNIPVYGSGGLTGIHNQSLIEGPGIIVGRKGTVGSIYWEERDFWPIDTVFYVEPKNDVDLSFYYYLINTLGLGNMNTDAAVPGLNRNNAYRIKIPEFPEMLMKLYAEFTADLHKLMSVKQSEKKILENLRDTLLPKLISGALLSQNNS